jgi:hypothetical protein
MSLRRPQNIMSGLSSGMQSVGKGVLGGAAALIAAPVVGARSEGWSGFAKGLGAGLAAAVALPVAGAAVGITQIARGAYNTPEAIMEANAGKRWDSHRRVWVAEDLVQESLKLSECSDDDILEKARERAKARGEAPGLEGALGGWIIRRRRRVHRVLRRPRGRARRHRRRDQASVLPTGAEATPG